MSASTRQPSTALRSLERAISLMPAGEPVTWGQLQAKLAEAIDDAEDSEWQDSMGEDL